MYATRQALAVAKTGGKLVITAVPRGSVKFVDRPLPRPVGERPPRHGNWEPPYIAYFNDEDLQDIGTAERPNPYEVRSLIDGDPWGGAGHRGRVAGV